MPGHGTILAFYLPYDCDTIFLAIQNLNIGGSYEEKT